VTTQEGTLNIIDNYGDLETLEKELCLSYKSAKLSPFVCRINKGRYQWEGKEYIFSNLFPDGTAIHGILADKLFKITETISNEEEGSIWLLHEYRGEDAGFPFHFNCEVKYSLKKGQALSVQTSITNVGDSSMPLADGWHPYFSFGEPIAGNILHIASGKMLEFDEKLLPSGKFVTDASFANPAPLGNRFLDNCFELDASLGNPVCTLFSPSKGVKLSFITDNNYPYLQLYTPPHRNSIAIENLSGAPNCFNNGMGLIKLGAGEEKSFEVTYVVS
jgi:aldose 1-epimerase